MKQPDLFGMPPSHRHDPVTSRKAAARAHHGAGAHRDRILVFLLEQGELGATAFESWQATGGARPSGAGTRLGELKKAGMVRQSSRTRPTDTGSAAMVWDLTLLGVERARQLQRVVA